MKSKKKFDPKVIQQFFIDHTEKIVIGLVAALFLFFAYTSITLNAVDGYSKKPEDLKKATDAASANINNGPHTIKAEEKTQFPPYAQQVDEFKTPIDPDAYQMPPAWNWKPIAPRRLRGAPEVFAVENLRAVPGRGAVPDAAGSRGRRWIVVTGLIPYKRQLAEYHAKFDGAAWNDPSEDVPKYAGYLVQRAEVTAGSEPQWSKLMVFPPADVNKMVGQAAEDVADPRYVNRGVTSPLPLLVDATWGTDAVSPPQIPLVERKKTIVADAPPAVLVAAPQPFTRRVRSSRYVPRPSAPGPAGTPARARHGHGRRSWSSYGRDRRDTGD